MKITFHNTQKLIKKAERKTGDFFEIAEFVKDCLRTGDLKHEIRITLLKNKHEVGDQFQRITGRWEKHRGLYSRPSDMIYLSVRDLSKRILAHEICHVILTKHFNPFMAGAVQETVCQWVERQL